jgi:hypothetical protein
MSISEHFQYGNDIFQSDIFVSDIGITDVDVGYRISPTIRSMSMPTYDNVVCARNDLKIVLFDVSWKKVFCFSMMGYLLDL